MNFLGDSLTLKKEEKGQQHRLSKTLMGIQEQCTIQTPSAVLSLCVWLSRHSRWKGLCGLQREMWAAIPK